MGVRPLPADHGKVCVGLILRDSAVLLGNEYSVVAWLVLCAAIKYEFRVFSVHFSVFSLIMFSFLGQLTTKTPCSLTTTVFKGHRDI